MNSSLVPSLPPLCIRRAVPADAQRVRDFVFAALRSYGIEPDPQGLDAPVAAFERAGEDASVLQWVAEYSGSVVGAIVLTLTGGEQGQVAAFYVDASYRGLGIGRALLDHVVAEAKARGLQQLQLETRSIFRAAVHLYQATGWVRGPDLPPGYGPERTYALRLRTDQGD